MPKEEKLVDIDTSGEGAEINLEEKETTNETVVEDSGESNDSSAKPDEQQLFRIANLNKKQVKRNKKK